MAMTVRRLIAELKKMPATATVAVSAHDQEPELGQFDGGVNDIIAAPAAMKERGYGVVITVG